jgi:hypothetical protein
MLFFAANLLKSSLPALPFVRLDFRVGEIGWFSCEMRFVEEGIFDSRRFGEELLSPRTALLLCGRRSGALKRVGMMGTETGFPAANIFGCDTCFCTGAVFCEIKGGRAPFDLKGFLVDFCRVGEGTGGRSSSSETSESTSVGLQRASASPPAAAAAAKMLRPVLGALVAPLRRGDSDKEAIEIGDGSAISMSIGVPANIVWARPKGVRAVFLTNFAGSGESIDRSVSSVDD